MSNINPINQTLQLMELIREAFDPFLENNRASMPEMMEIAIILEHGVICLDTEDHFIYLVNNSKETDLINAIRTIPTKSPFKPNKFESKIVEILDSLTPNFETLDVKYVYAENNNDIENPNDFHKFAFYVKEYDKTSKPSSDDTPMVDIYIVVTEDGELDPDSITDISPYSSTLEHFFALDEALNTYHQYINKLDKTLLGHLKYPEESNSVKRITFYRTKIPAKLDYRKLNLSEDDCIEAHEGFTQVFFDDLYENPYCYEVITEYFLGNRPSVSVNKCMTPDI